MARDLKQQKGLGSIFKDTAVERTSQFIDRLKYGGADVLAGGPGDTGMGKSGNILLLYL